MGSSFQLAAELLGVMLGILLGIVAPSIIVTIRLSRRADWTLSEKTSVPCWFIVAGFMGIPLVTSLLGMGHENLSILLQIPAVVFVSAPFVIVIAVLYPVTRVFVESVVERRMQKRLGEEGTRSMPGDSK